MAEQAVEEKAGGTIPEAEEQAQAASPEKGGTPESLSKVSPKEEKVEEKPTLTQTQHEALLHMATSESGRLQKDAETERDAAKTSLEKTQDLFEDIQVELKEVRAEIEELTSGDPKKFDLVKRETKLREDNRELKKNLDEAKADWDSKVVRVEASEATDHEITIWDIATGQKGGDPVQLKTLCAKVNATTKEAIRNVAETMWPEKAEAKAPVKKGVEEVKEPKEKLNLDPGETHGGGEETEKERLDKRYPKTATK